MFCAATNTFGSRHNYLFNNSTFSCDPGHICHFCMACLSVSTDGESPLGGEARRPPTLNTAGRPMCSCVGRLDASSVGDGVTVLMYAVAMCVRVCACVCVSAPYGPRGRPGPAQSSR